MFSFFSDILRTALVLDPDSALEQTLRKHVMKNLLKKVISFVLESWCRLCVCACVNKCMSVTSIYIDPVHFLFPKVQPADFPICTSCCDDMSYKFRFLSPKK